MTVATLRKELQGYIAKIPERKLIILKPLITEFAKPIYTIEQANAEETKRAEKRIKEFYKDPSSFEPLD